MKRYLIVATLFLTALSGCQKNNPTTVPDNKKPTGEITVTGTVKGDDGTLLEGVVVSDGISCVKTDARGKYQLPADLSKKAYVFVSTPAGYSAPGERGQAVFFKAVKNLKKGSDGKYTADFTLNKIDDPNRYTLFLYADPQPRKNSGTTDQIAFKSLDACNDMYRDMKEQKALIKDRPVYGIALGDIVHQDLSLLENHKDGIKTTGISNYNIIGNHDQGHVMGQSDEDASKAYEEKMGPANYSFNLGGMHFLMLDNMIAPGAGDYSDNCKTGLTADIWTFVQNDLALVPKTTPLMVCAHSPMMRMSSGGDRSGENLTQLRALLKTYPKAYVWAGHTHSSFNYAPQGEVIESHTLTRVTGALWTNEFLGGNGTPRGYLIFDYDNGKINWRFHPIPYQGGAHQKPSATPDYTYRDWNYDASGTALMKSGGARLDDNYQMQVFAPGVYENNYLYVNVFMWDEQWEKPKFNGQALNPVSKTDKKYSYAEWVQTDFYHGKYSWYSEVSLNNCMSMFRAYVESGTKSGTVSVKDRFGNEYSTNVSWQ